MSDWSFMENLFDFDGASEGLPTLNAQNNKDVEPEDVNMSIDDVVQIGLSEVATPESVSAAEASLCASPATICVEEDSKAGDAIEDHQVDIVMAVSPAATLVSAGESIMHDDSNRDMYDLAAVERVHKEKVHSKHQSKSGWPKGAMDIVSKDGVACFVRGVRCKDKTYGTLYEPEENTIWMATEQSPFISKILQSDGTDLPGGERYVSTIPRCGRVHKHFPTLLRHVTQCEIHATQVYKCPYKRLCKDEKGGNKPFENVRKDKFTKHLREQHKIVKEVDYYETFRVSKLLP